MRRRHLILLLAGALLAAVAPAQDEPLADAEPADGELADGEFVPEDDELSPLPPEPTNPREELFLAIELKDTDAARGALRSGADVEISSGDPSPLGTAALHDDLRMVVLLLDFGGDPNATGDSPLEEAIRNENGTMVQLFLRAGARVPPGEEGRELFRLAQRGPAAHELSQILLDAGANPDLCLAAATSEARADLIRFCLERGGDVGALPRELNILSVALRSGEPQLVDLVLAQGLDDRVLAGALDAAVVSGNPDVTRQAIAAGAVPAFAQIEAAIASGRPQIAQFLLDQSPPGDATMLAGGDVAALIQRAEDLGLDELASALRRKSGLSEWTMERVMPAALVVLLLAVLAALASMRLGGRRGAAISVPAGLGAPTKSRPARPAARAPGAPAVPTAPPAREPAVAAVAPTAPTAPAVPAAAAAPVVPPAPVAHDQATRPVGPLPRPGPAPPAEASGGAWEIVPEAGAEAPESGPPVSQAGPVSEPVATEVALRMPEVDLSRPAETVFRAARLAASGEAVRPDATDRRHVVLVTPARVTMLRPCPAPGSLSVEELAAAAAIAPAAAPKNVAVIAYNEIDALRGDVSAAIPFFDLLTRLGYLGHAVWIFEGHVSAMAAGCQDADVLIVDDGMMRYLPGNWRSVASRVMRGADVYVFERNTGALRRL